MAGRRGTRRPGRRSVSGPAVVAGSALALLAPVALAAQAGWQVDPEPVLRIVDTDAAGEVVLYEPVDATRMSDGRIIVGDNGDARLAVFDSSGEVVGRIGGPGEGPGEFEELWWVDRCGRDSVFAWDITARRMTVFSGDGELEREFRYPADPEAPQPFRIACSAEGTLAFHSLFTDPSAVEPLPDIEGLRGRAPIRLSRLDGEPIAVVPDVWADEMAIFGGGAAPRPAGKRTTFAVAGDRLYVGTGDSAAVRVFGLDGEPLRTLRLEGLERRPPARRNAEADVDRLAGLIPGPLYEEASERLLGLPLPERLPPYSALLADPDGLLWVVTSFPGDETTDLMALDADGSVRGEVSIPASLRVLEVGRDYILGLGRTGLGLPWIALYRLERGP